MSGELGNERELVETSMARSSSAVVLSSLCFLVMLAWLPLKGIDSLNDFSVSMAILQTIVALAALSGFWAVRSSAVNAARNAAKECSPECTDDWLTKNIEDHLVTFLTSDDGRELVQDAISGLKARESLATHSIEELFE